MVKEKRIFALLFALLGVVYIGGLFLPIMEVDAAQYAEMSREMLHSHHYLQLYDGTHAYLDKPPLIFWVSALSYSIFGVSEWAYRLPSLLATVLAVYSTWKLARLFYTETVAWWAALILASCQAFFLFNHDVKTDNLLTSAVVFTLWQLSLWFRQRRWSGLLLGGIGAGLAMLAKGPVGLMVPAAALGSDILLRRDWKALTDLRWLLLLPIVALVISPFLYGLYMQFGTQGIHFYLWTQSFGRITGESEWNNHVGPFFLSHTFLWSFLPWTLLSLIALVMGIREMALQKFRLPREAEAVMIPGFLLMFVSLSSSHYQLPHYIFVLYPMCAIFTARWLYLAWQQYPRLYAWLRSLQLGVYILAGVAGLALLWFVFQPLDVAWLVVMAALATGSIAVAWRSGGAAARIIIPGVLMIAGVNLALNYSFYPRLLQYQASIPAGRYVKDRQIPKDQFFYFYSTGSHTLDFYSGRMVPYLNRDLIADTLKTRSLWVLANQDDHKYFDSIPRYPGAEKDVTFRHFTVQNLTLPFLNPATRPGTLQHYYLLHLAQAKSEK